MLTIWSNSTSFEDSSKPCPKNTQAGEEESLLATDNHTQIYGHTGLKYDAKNKKSKKKKKKSVQTSNLLTYSHLLLGFQLSHEWNSSMTTYNMNSPRVLGRQKFLPWLKQLILIYARPLMLHVMQSNVHGGPVHWNRAMEDCLFPRPNIHGPISQTSSIHRAFGPPQ